MIKLNHRFFRLWFSWSFLVYQCFGQFPWDGGLEAPVSLNNNNHHHNHPFQRRPYIFNPFLRNFTTTIKVHPKLVKKVTLLSPHSNLIVDLQTLIKNDFVLNSNVFGLNWEYYIIWSLSGRKLPFLFSFFLSCVGLW